MTTESTEYLQVSDLAFDVRNPRLVEYDISERMTEKALIETLWYEMDVRELVMSMAASGFFPHEPLIVIREDGKNVVIEGNRRLAALRLLLDPALVATLEIEIPSISNELRQELRSVPVVWDTRRDAWQYLGFKHVNGPAKWSSYAKSQFIANVHRDFGVPMDEIAEQIGDTHQTVQRLFRSLMVLEQAERMGVFNREDRWHKHFSASHLYTGLDYAGISSFIGLRPADEEPDAPVPEENKDRLREMLLWMYGSTRDDVRPAMRSQNPDLGRLNRVVQSTEAIAALRAGVDLATAFDLSRPSSNLFEESVYAAKRELEKAHSSVSTGYDNSENLLKAVGDIVELAEDLYFTMERKREPRRIGRASGRP